MLYVSPAYEKIWGRSTKALLDNYEEWAKAIYPDDLEYAGESFQRIVETGGGESREYRIVHPDGTDRWISDRGFVVYDENDVVQRIVGIAEDITERKQAEDELNKYKEHLEELVKERTAELEAKNAELEHMNSVFVGREFRIKELRDRIQALEEN